MKAKYLFPLAVFLSSAAMAEDKGYINLLDCPAGTFDSLSTEAGLFATGIVPGVLMALYGWKALVEAGPLPMPEVKNPTELKTAISFGLLYAVALPASITLAKAWRSSASLKLAWILQRLSLANSSRV